MRVAVTLTSRWRVVALTGVASAALERVHLCLSVKRGLLSRRIGRVRAGRWRVAGWGCGVASGAHLSVAPWSVSRSGGSSLAAAVAAELGAGALVQRPVGVGGAAGGVLGGLDQRPAQVARPVLAQRAAPVGLPGLVDARAEAGVADQLDRAREAGDVADLGGDRVR